MSDLTIKYDSSLRLITNTNNIHIKCDCGEELLLELGKWEINIVGIIEFKCPKCGKITRTPGLFRQEPS